MACKGTLVKPKEVERMYKLYQELGTYKAVAKRMRRSPGTVAKHLQAYELASSKKLLDKFHQL